MIKLIETGLGLVSEILGYVNTKESRKYMERMIELQLSIEKERSLGHDRDDSMLEQYYRELEIITKAAQYEMRALIAKK